MKYDDFLEEKNIKKNSNFVSLELLNVNVYEKENRILLEFHLDELINIEEIFVFVEQVKDYFQDPLIKKIDVKMNYGKINNNIEFRTLFKSILDEIARKSPRYAVLNDFPVSFENDAFCINVDKDSSHLKVYERKLMDLFSFYGINNKIIISINEKLETTKELINKISEESEQDIALRQAEAERSRSEQPAIKLKNTKFVRKYDGECDKISDIPVDQFSINEYQYNKGPLDFIIEGEIFSHEIRKMPKCTLLEMKVTDYTDSIMVKKFLRKQGEIDETSRLADGFTVRVSGKASYDSYSRDVTIMADTIEVIGEKKKNERMDKSSFKRVELHTHTIMSNMDGITPASDYIETAIKWGHKAIAFTDHSGVYSIPDIFHSTEGKAIKPIYGVELNFVDENDFAIAFTNHSIDLSDATYVVFDIESTGFSIDFDSIVEIAACKVKNGEIIDEFESFINPGRLMGEGASKVTGITDDMLKDAPDTKTVLTKFLDFTKGSILVAHNAKFDMGHIYNNYEKLGFKYEEYPVLDTMQIAQSFYNKDLKRFNLKAVAKLFKVKNEQAHRAIFDTRATAEVFIKMLNDIKAKGIKNYNEINGLIEPDVRWKYQFPHHINLLVKNQVGYKNLFKIVSDALTVHFFKEGRLLKNVLDQYREGILVGSSCVNGIVFETALNKSYEELLSVMGYFDYIEVQPPCAYSQLAEQISVDYNVAIKDIIEKIIKAAKELGKIVVATGDVHYLNKEDKMYRDIYIRTKVVGGGLHHLANYEQSPLQYFMTTEEMLTEFSFLGGDLAHEIVVKNTNLIADMVEPIVAFNKELYSPRDDAFVDRGVPSIEADLQSMVYSKANKLYGKDLPKLVSDRLKKELDSIVKNKFSPIYYMAYLLVKKSLDDGYLVGSRGSVGSSFVATMMDITEVNPLSPHYRCPKCCFSAFKMNDEEKERYGVREEELPLQKALASVESGFDLPDAVCPICGEKLKKDGHDIPFETFLGFKGDKVPDIDLNFSGDYQSKAHLYVRELMGNDYAFRAGTIATVAEKTAFGYVKGYFEDKGVIVRKAEIERLAKKIEGVKRSTGQHPGGIVVVPHYVDIYDVTPIQYPADDTNAEWRTTHFDYHSFESNLLKLDILGHDDPTVIKYIMDYVHEHQSKFPFTRPQDIPIDDSTLYKLFSGTEVIGIKPGEISSGVASYAVPELGTSFVMQMLSDTKPKTFGELVKISGLSHGTDVWLNNAQSLVLGKTDFGRIDFKDVIGCRDDIMVNLMYMGLEPAKAFEIMEFVRKGKPSKDYEKWQKHKEYMASMKVPEWYIWSCERIKYMFPKAHATAYVMMAMRIAWFKVYYPILFYGAYFSKRAVQFDPEVMVAGPNAIRNRIRELNDIVSGRVKSADGKAESANKAADLLVCLDVALEMTMRKLTFKMVDIEKSDAMNFIIDGNSLLMPFISIDGLGEVVAYNLVAEREKAPYTSKNDVLKRGKVNKTVLDKMSTLGVISSLKDDDEKPQAIDLFSFQE